MIVQHDNFADSWLSQFLALRDVSQFVVGASIQYTVNGETREVGLLPSSMMARNAVLQALDHLQIPPYLSKVDLVAMFSDIFRIILPDTPNLSPNLFGSQADDSKMDAIDILCIRLNNRQMTHRVGDREMMHTISQITRNITVLSDPSGQFRTTRPRLYVVNCQQCHLVGYSQLRDLENLEFLVCCQVCKEMLLLFLQRMFLGIRLLEPEATDRTGRAC